MNIGFVGLGIMGGSMAMNIRNGGHDMVVHDLRQEAATPLLEAGAQWADTPQQVAEASEVVFTSLPGPVEVEAVALGESGLLQGMGPGQATSTSAPTHLPWCVASTKPSPRRASTCWTRSERRSCWGPLRPAGHLGWRRPGGVRASSASASGLQRQTLLRWAIGCGSVAKLVHNCTGYVVQTHWPRCSPWSEGWRRATGPVAGGTTRGARTRGTFEGLAEHLLPGKFDPPDFALAPSPQGR